MSQPTPSLTNRIKIFWVLFFTLIGFGLRVQRLDFQPLWGDEGWSIYFAVQSLPQLLALTALDIHPPLYYILLKTWFGLAGVGAETGRFLSVLTGTLLIPALYLLGRRLFNDLRMGAAAAAVAAVMPLAIYYSQEVRMYQLVTLLGVLSMVSLVRWQAYGRRQELIAYVGLTTAALYTHYYAGFLILGQALYLLLDGLRHRSPGKNSLSILIARLRPVFWVGLLYLPWLIYLGPRLTTYVKNKRVVEGYLPLSSIRFFGDHFVAFSVGHISDALQQYIWTALPFILVAVLGFIAVLSMRSTRTSLLLFYLLTPLAMGYVVNLAFPFTPRFFERTLLLAAPAYWILIGAGIIWLWDRQYLLVGTFVLAMLLIVNISLLSFYSTPRYPRQDYRPLLQDIAARATPNDTLLASYQWQLGFYHAYLPPPRPRLFEVPGWGQGWAGANGQSQLEEDLTQIFAASPRLWFPAHQALGHFWEDQAEAAIARRGYPALLEWYSPQTKLTLAGAPAATTIKGPIGNFENRLALLAATIGAEPFEAGRGVVPIDLTWRKNKSLGSNYLVSLRLADAAGRTWAIRDSHPQAGQAHFTDLAPGDRLVDRHGLLIAAGAPPGTYRLLLSVRRTGDAHPLNLLDADGQPQGVELLLAQITVKEPDPPVDPAALPVQLTMDATFGKSARLIGYSLGSAPFQSGETLPLTLFWESRAAGPGPLLVSIQLKDNAGQPVVIHEQPPIRPTTDWLPGTLLRDPHDVSLPATLPPGTYHLVVGLLTPDKTLLDVSGGKQVELTTLTTVDRPHNFEPPQPQIELAVNFNNQIKLVGLDTAASSLQPGDALPVTLHWRAQATPDKSWTVFVHLLNEQGDIVAQQDQVPGAGRFPTTGWLPEEYIIDPYTLHLPADGPPGEYRLEIGLYDPNDFSRLPVIEAGEIVNDHVILENWPILVE